MGDCDACISCSTTTGTCVVAYDACFGPQANEDCYDFLVCADDCNGSDDCYAGCVEDHPQGVQLYSELVDCVICGDCSQSCDGAGSGC